MPRQFRSDLHEPYAMQGIRQLVSLGRDTRKTRDYILRVDLHIE